ncbi:cytochrome P450 [Boletus edulis]|nr:cytochrome P450 [Boletus edulis]
MELTPGMHYIGRCMVSVVFPIVGLFLLLQRLLAYAGIPLSTGGSVALLVAIFLAVLAVYIVSIEISQRRRAAALGARLVPRIQGYLPGNMDMLLHMIGRTETDYIGTALLEQIRLYGPVINLRFFWEDVFLTIEPQNIKASLRSILATDFNSYVKGDKFKETADSLLGTGVFNSDGELSMLTLAFPCWSRRRLSSMYHDDAVSRFTLDSASEFLFGHCIDTLAAGLPYPYNFSRPGVVSQDSKNVALDFASAFAAAQQAMTRRNLVGGTWPLWELFRDPLKEPMKSPILKDAIAKQKASQGLPDADKDAEDETLLDHLMRQTTDIKILKDQTLNILLAGRDTTASTLMSAIYLLATHPDVLRRLREEILKKVGPTRRPSYDDITGDEIPPSCSKCQLFVPAGTIVSYSVLLMQRRTDLWGPDALEFDPDRFLDDRLRKYLTPNPFIFLPFNAWPPYLSGTTGMCPCGDRSLATLSITCGPFVLQFAYNEMSFMLIRLLQHFSSITLSPESQDPQYRPPAAWARGEGRQVIEKFHPRHHLTLYAKGGLWVKMEPAEM